MNFFLLLSLMAYACASETNPATHSSSKRYAAMNTAWDKMYKDKINPYGDILLPCAAYINYDIEGKQTLGDEKKIDALKKVVAASWKKEQTAQTIQKTLLGGFAVFGGLMLAKKMKLLSSDVMYNIGIRLAGLAGAFNLFRLTECGFAHFKQRSVDSNEKSEIDSFFGTFAEKGQLKKAHEVMQFVFSHPIKWTVEDANNQSYVIGLHGLGDCAENFDRNMIKNVLKANGLTVDFHDSWTLFFKKLTVGGELEQIKAAYGIWFAKQLQSDKPQTVIAHSRSGGILASLFSHFNVAKNSDQPAGYILYAPNLDTAETIKHIAQSRAAQVVINTSIESGYQSDFIEIDKGPVGVASNLNPVLLVHGNKDTIVPIATTKTYFENLKKQTGNKVIFREMKDEGHNGLDIYSKYYALEEFVKNPERFYNEQQHKIEQ